MTGQGTAKGKSIIKALPLLEAATDHLSRVGWEHTQNLGLYVVRSDGSGFRKVLHEDGFSFGTPQWSPNGKRLIYNNMTRENTYYAHGVSSEQTAVAAQIYSVDVATGRNIIKHTSDSNLKVGQHYIANSTNIGYVIKAGDSEGVGYTSPGKTHKAFNLTGLREPSWSPDGSKIVYNILNWDQQASNLKLWSFDDEWDYRYDLTTTFNGRILLTLFQLHGCLPLAQHGFQHPSNHPKGPWRS